MCWDDSKDILRLGVIIALLLLVYLYFILSHLWVCCDFLQVHFSCFRCGIQTRFHGHSHYITLDFNLLPSRGLLFLSSRQGHNERVSSWVTGICSLTTTLKYDKLSGSVDEKNGSRTGGINHFFQISGWFRGAFSSPVVWTSRLNGMY